MAIEWTSLCRAVRRIREQSYLTARTSVGFANEEGSISDIDGSLNDRCLPALLTESNRLTAFFGRVVMFRLVLA